MFAKSISYGPAHYILTFYIIFEVNCVLLGGRKLRSNLHILIFRRSFCIRLYFSSDFMVSILIG